MQWLKIVAPALVGSALVVAGCSTQYQPAAASGSKSISKSTRKTGPDPVLIEKAASAIPNTHTAAPPPFPHQEAIAPCKIGVAGGGKDKTIPGTCSTTVRTVGQDKVITFTETWNAQNYRGAGSPSHGLLISVWQLTVDANGRVIHETHTGDTPPQSPV